MRPILFTLLSFLLLAVPAWAAPQRYALQPAESKVAFTWNFGRDEVQGQMPVARADLTIDFAELGRSEVDVAVDAAGAEAGFPFASQAMKGPTVLDVRNFPEIRFMSTGVRRNGDGAIVEGNITVRGVTRPMAFAAELYRQRGTEAGDLSNLTILLTGSLRRSEFGATGWSDMVGDVVRLQIVARIEAVG